MASETHHVLYVSIPGKNSRCYLCEGEQLQLGRGSNNHIQIDDPAVSKVHCELIRSSDFPQWKFRDLGSTNGSKLNGKKVEWDTHPLNEGDEMLLGNLITVQFLILATIQHPESLEIEDDEQEEEVNPVAAAVARQSKEDLEGTQLIKLPHRKKVK